MATASNANASPGSGANSEDASSSEDSSSTGDDATSMASRLQTAATVIWWSFLALVIIFTLIPVAGTGLGAVRYAPPKPETQTAYLALVGFTLVGTVALIAAELLDA